MYRTDLLSNKRILITGGGSGLGAAMALRFAELGAQLIICGRREVALQATAHELRSKTGAQVHTFVCDLRQADAVEVMFQRIWEEGPLYALVNNAAATFIAQTEKLSARAADAILATTLHGAMYCTLAAGKRWIEASHCGVVLSILSTSVRTGRAFTTPSAIAKSGVEAMTRSLAVEWGPKGIRLVAIAPGPFPTAGATKQLMPEQRLNQSPASARNPLGRVGDSVELTNLAAYLISGEAGYINGETVAIDGGAHLRTSGAEDLLQWSEADWDAHRAKRAASIPH
jgi:NAD(P)-dependent dehydrogenase (short-subunit alcohol dehydrogenase family)